MLSVDENNIRSVSVKFNVEHSLTDATINHSADATSTPVDISVSLTGTKTKIYCSLFYENVK